MGSYSKILAPGFEEQADITKITRRVGRKKNIFCPCLEASLFLLFSSPAYFIAPGDWCPVCTVSKVGSLFNCIRNILGEYIRRYSESQFFLLGGEAYTRPLSIVGKACGRGEDGLWSHLTAQILSTPGQ
jgi:hypothetical protein